MVSCSAIAAACGGEDGRKALGSITYPDDGRGLGSESTDVEDADSWNVDTIDDSSSEVFCWAATKAEASDEVDAWEVERVLASCRWRGAAYYLVQWREYEQPYWELEEDLVESNLGGVRLLRQLLDRRRTDDLRAEASRCNAKRCQPKDRRPRRLALSAARARLRRLRESHAAAATALWPDYMTSIKRSFAAVGAEVLRVENICNASRLAGISNSANCLMVFHGTSALRLASIIENGLQKPGTGGVSVVNGSVHGVAIYTASLPQLAYARDFNYLGDGELQMFCCAGASDKAREAGGYSLFEDGSDVVPCFLVTAKPCQSLRLFEPRYSPQLVSDVPVEVWDPDTNSNVHVLPSEGISLNEAIAVRKPQLATVILPVRPRARYVARGDHLNEGELCQGRPMWYSRERRSVTLRQLRALPRSAKQPIRQGCAHAPNTDRTRGQKSTPKLTWFEFMGYADAF